MTGLCCRCQVRHDDMLCCRHGVICDDAGRSDVLDVVVCAVVFAAVLAGSLWLGYNATGGVKVAAALLLCVSSIPVLRWSLRPLDDDLPCDDADRARRAHEPKETR